MKVNIWGMEYALKSDSDPLYIEELAAYVDQKMRALGEGSQVKSQTKIAVLVALNIADELFHLKRKHEMMINEIESTSEEISENVDRYLNQYAEVLK
ncbi:MAG: cell division protein ZapA [Calditrichia bacterium]